MTNIKKEIESIASVHLGRAGDGSVVKPYETPDHIDSTLLVGVPRELNRTQYGIEEDNLPFYGIDTWNAYEFSCLLENGFPITGVLKWSYPSDSKNIVESKSMKLYLNSFNMEKIGKTVDECKGKVITRITNDLKETVGGSVRVHLHFDNNVINNFDGIEFIKLENIIDVTSIDFDEYNEDPNILEVVDNFDIKQITSNALRSNCRVTNQPDWGDVYIIIDGDKTVTPESLMKYIVSMRKENHFHEEICECIYKRLFDLLKPDRLLVACLYTRRGGLDINPVRCNDLSLLGKASFTDVFTVSEKTMRQ
jgi:7-cyano-7-deazaguanine reductase